MIVNFLIKKGANVSAVGQNGRVPLHWAAQYGYFEIVEKLLATRAVDINILDNDGNNALHLARQNGHLKIVEYLLKKGSKKIGEIGRASCRERV